MYVQLSKSGKKLFFFLKGNYLNISRIIWLEDIVEKLLTLTEFLHFFHFWLANLMKNNDQLFFGFQFLWANFSTGSLFSMLFS